MATNAQEVFDIAMNLIDEVNESTGATDTSETKAYKQRTLTILNKLGGNLYQYSDTYEVSETGKRPIMSAITDFTSAIDLDDYICKSVLPSGLAGILLAGENDTLAAFYQQDYEELCAKLKTGFPQESEDITDVYGGIEYGYFSRW